MRLFFELVFQERCLVELIYVVAAPNQSSSYEPCTTMNGWVVMGMTFKDIDEKCKKSGGLPSTIC